MADTIKSFSEQAEQVLKNIQEIRDKSNKKIVFEKIRPACTRFMEFYQYYEDALQKEGSQGYVQIHLKELKAFANIENDPQEAYSAARDFNNTQLEIIKKAQMTRQLQKLLSAFKRVFINALGYDFIESVVIETENHEPIVIQFDDDAQGLENFINSYTDDWQGRLEQDTQMYQKIIANNSKFKQKKIDTSYVEVYQEARRRIDIFYNYAQRKYGEALLLYKTEGTWKKFYVLNLGDLKEGFLSLIYNEIKLPMNMQKRIEEFTNQIGSVDNAAGTIYQDIALLNTLVSSKTARAQTGSNEGLINIIKTISETGDLYAIRQVYLKDKSTESKARNRILYSDKNDEKNFSEADKNKVAKMISKESLEKAQKEINGII